MKRLHISLAVVETEMERTVEFYATLFGAPPGVRQPGYAKWMLEDPRVNFVLDATAAAARGAGRIDHLGIQVETTGELAELAGRLKSAGQQVLDQPAAHCCYARADKSWVADPQGILWESFRTTGHETEYGEGAIRREALGPHADAASSCCVQG